MLRLNRATILVPVVLLAFVAALPERVEAQTGATEAAGVLEEIVVVGSRRRDRSASDSPVPVDVIGGDDFLAHGDSDLDSVLAALVPSYNVAQEPISDAATLIRPATLRSLPPDATLVLVNGKRRHRAAVIALLGAGISGGSQGPDLSVIPVIALDRLEVLRDGASAQYGSDAIAGIMNFVLKEDAEGVTLDAKYGSYFEGDGNSMTLAANVGLPLTDAGFANLSFEFKEADPTTRSAQRGDAQDLIDAGNTHVRQPAAQIWGAPEISGDFKLFGNFGLDLGNGSEVYAFGNWAERQVEGGFYYRNPHTRGGVFRGPELADGTKTVKVADLTGDGSGNCPVVRIVDNVADADALASIRNDPGCYSLIEKFPGGFTPQFGGYIDDLSIAGGLRGELDSGWFYDVSATAGRSAASFYIYNTINPQLLAQRNDIPIYYQAGAYTETDRVINFDMSKPFDVANLWGPVNVAYGLEYRDETFRIHNGDPNSFYIDPNIEHGLAAQGFGVGSNGFAGFQPGDAGEHTVSAYGAYIDVESDVSESLLLGGALRYESYPDYGNTLDGKIAARLQVGRQRRAARRGEHGLPRTHRGAGEPAQRHHGVPGRHARGHCHVAADQSRRPAEGRHGADAGRVREHHVRHRHRRRRLQRDPGLLQHQDRGSSLLHQPVHPDRGRHQRASRRRRLRRHQLLIGALLLQPADRGSIRRRPGGELSVLSRRRRLHPDGSRQLVGHRTNPVQSGIHQRKPPAADRAGTPRFPVIGHLEPCAGLPGV